MHLPLRTPFITGCMVAATLILIGGHGSADALEERWGNSLGMEFVQIPAGSFMMGTPADQIDAKSKEIQHRVTLTQSYYMQTTEVTLKQWRSLMGTRWFGRRKGGDLTPVARISWHDCMEFIEKLNRMGEGTYRLPTEAEWEYACRAGSRSPFPWGQTIDCEQAMYANQPLKQDQCVEYIKSRGMEVDRPAPVKSYPPNAWGLYDMNGNVWEWCLDWFAPYPAGPQVDPRGPKSGTDRVRRGGSYFSHRNSCRCTNRAYGHPSAKYQTTGFRLVREAK